MAFLRCIGRWTLTALFINSIIGGGIFGVPGELNRMLGRASPFAMLFAALGMAVVMACMAEVASHFSESGGPYLYVRSAFGRFMGMQVGWFHLLTVVAAVAGLANLFVDTLSQLLSLPADFWTRASIMAALIAVPAAANYRGVRTGANLCNVVTVAKLAPLALLILAGIFRFAREPHVIHTSEPASPGLSNWARAMVFLLFTYGGWEDSLIPASEIREPRRTIPFALGVALLACAAIYMLLQFVTVQTIGAKATTTPLQEVASVLLGRSGAGFVAVALVVSLYGWISADLLNAPRLAYSLAAAGDFPSLFKKIHRRFQTPAYAIVLYALAAWLLAISGGFLWAAALSAGSMTVYYALTCASLPRLRKLRRNPDALRIPAGPLFSILGVMISLALMTGLKQRELLLMLVTALIATANWLWARQHQPMARNVVAAQ